MSTVYHTYNESREICTDNGGFLPEPRNENEDKFLKDFQKERFWLGSVQNSNGQFIWLSDGSELVHTNWYTSNCCNDGCVYRTYDGDDWATRSCDTQINPFYTVCQRKDGKFSCYICQNFFF